MYWWEGPLAGFDTETTGVDTATDRIVTAALVVDEPGKDVMSKTWLLDPGVPIPEAASEIHGVTTEHARTHGLPAKHGVALIAAAVALVSEQMPVVVFNAPFDLSLLVYECRRHGLSTVMPRVVLDPLVMDRRLSPRRRGKRTLGAMADVYGVSFGDQHSAPADARAAITLVREMGEIASFPEPQLVHDRQIGWHKVWAEEFEGWLRSQGRGDVIDRGWPLGSDVQL